MTTLNELIHKGGFTSRQAKTLLGLGGGSVNALTVPAVRFSSTLQTYPAETANWWMDFSTGWTAQPISDTNPLLECDLSDGTIYYPKMGQYYLLDIYLNLSATDPADVGKQLTAYAAGTWGRAQNSAAIRGGGSSTEVYLQVIDYNDDEPGGMDVQLIADLTVDTWYISTIVMREI